VRLNEERSDSKSSPANLTNTTPSTRRFAHRRRQISHYQHLLDNASNSDAIVKHNLNSEGTRSSLALLERSKSQLDSEMPSKDPSSSDSEKIDTAGLQTALMELTKVMAVRAAALKHFKDTSGEFDMSEKLSEVKIGEKGSTKEVRSDEE